MGFLEKVKTLGSVAKSERNSWGVGIGPGFNSVCYIGPRNYVDNHDRTIRIVGLKTAPYDFTAADVKYVQLLATTVEWVKYKIRFNDGKIFYATLRLKGGRSNYWMPFNVSWLTFELWLKDKIYKTPNEEAQDVVSDASAEDSNCDDRIGLQGTQDNYDYEAAIIAERQREKEEKQKEKERKRAERKEEAERKKKEKEASITDEMRVARKKRKKLIAILMPICVVLAAIIVLLPLYFTATLGFAFTEDGIYICDSGYHTNGLLITDYKGSKTDLTFPTEILGKKVLGIGGDIDNKGFRNLTSVTIPDSVTSIWWCAFEDCSGLTSVTIGNSVTSIESSAFSDCSGLTSITIPNSVTRIGYYVFGNCRGLTTINYQGTKAQWNAIAKDPFAEPFWGEIHPVYTHTIHCTDGDISG